MLFRPRESIPGNGLTIGVAKLTTTSPAKEHVEEVLWIELIRVHPTTPTVKVRPHSSSTTSAHTWIPLCRVIGRVRIEGCSHVCI